MGLMSNMVVGGLAGGSIGALGGYATADPGMGAQGAIKGGLLGLGIGAGAGLAKFGIEKGVGALKGAYKNVTNPPHTYRPITRNGINQSDTNTPEIQAQIDDYLQRTGFGFPKMNDPFEKATDVVKRVRKPRVKKT